ncbi:MAG: TrmB family transcriptional regulator [Candidatus Marinimicrobia bacterium]|nr:TrmB family transcriptional regulator [Candidatus Neomarinimicrobiota bacterium]
MKKLIADLKDLGLSELESQIYLALYQEAGLTGYRIAQIINRPIPNSYKALSTLETKGLVISEEGRRSKVYSALPLSEFLDIQEKSFQRRRSQLEANLKQLVPADQQEGIFRISDFSQVLAKARSLIQKAEISIMGDIFPPMVELLKSELEAAAKRGVPVFLLTYDDTILDGCHHSHPNPGDHPLERWDNEWLDMCIDGVDFMQSVLNQKNETVHQAIWGHNIYLGVNVTARLGFEMLLRQVMKTAEDTPAANQIKNAHDALYDKIFLKTELIAKYQEVVNYKSESS